jgi:peptide/nickel transport system permease protein
MMANPARPLAASRLPAWRWPSLPIAGVVAFLAALAIVAVLGQAGDPDSISLTDRSQPPIGFGGTWDHPLGTDGLGRDILARVIAGARVSLLIALGATLVAGTIGSVIGLLGGYFGGLADRITTWLGDVQLAAPFVVIAIGVSASIEPSALTVILILGVTGWATYARVARLAAQPLRTAPFVDAARVAGASSGRVAFRHVLPVIAPPLLAIGSQQAGLMLLYEAALSYLGLGVPAGTITWGGMISDARESAQTAWWATVMPGLAIVIVVIGLNGTGVVLERRLTGERTVRKSR